MLPDRFAALVNLTGFAAALVLYAMLLVMVVRSPQTAMVSALVRRLAGARDRRPARGSPPDLLLVATACLGLVWNLGALGLFGLEDFGVVVPPPAGALVYASLGFLPAVVVHGALRPAVNERHDKGAVAIVGAGYLLSSVAAALHLARAWDGEPVSVFALRLLTGGFLGLVLVLAVQARREVSARRALSFGALAVFAVSALHLADHEALRDSWFVELLGHHASLPLAVAILYQDYPFAFADLFLKRVIVVLGGLGLALGVYTGAASWLEPGSLDPGLALALVSLGAAVAFSYPAVRRAAHWFVDAVVLRRPDYAALRANLVQEVSQAETSDDVLSAACGRLAPALAARQSSCWRIDSPGRVVLASCCPGTIPDRADLVDAAYREWLASEHAQTVQVNAKKTFAVVVLPTAEPPRFAMALGELAGGRRLLSGDISTLEGVARTLARRIDLLRLGSERSEQMVREAEIRRLASEAELRALRAQINPHFLFNALTTIGYLIQTSPGVALEKLVHLTELLRRVLRSEGEFTTLGKEIELVRLYLEIEHARFEERLQVSIDVPAALYPVPVPALILQPLVENAIKHGIAPAKAGGLVEIRASLGGPAARRWEPAADDAQTPRTLCLTVRDTGPGARSASGPHPGIGLRSVEQRLRHHYGEAASLQFVSGSNGTLVTLQLPSATLTRRHEPAGLHRMTS